MREQRPTTRGAPSTQPDATRCTCPRGHLDGIEVLAEQIIPPIDDAIHCKKCPANYVKIDGRWFEVT